MQFLAVKDWADHQHYRNRNPPWIKLHYSTLDNYAFGSLPDGAKAHLMLIWLLASRTNGILPNDPEWISRRIGARERLQLQVLIDAGFLIPAQDASAALAERPQVATPRREETEAEREKRTPTAGEAREIGLTRGELLGLVRKCCAPRQGKVPEAEMTTNASVVDTIAGRGWTYAKIGHAVVGTQMRRDRGEIGCIPKGAGWTLKYLLDATPDVDPLQVGLNAYYEAGKPPPPPKKGTGPEGVADIVARFTKQPGAA